MESTVKLYKEATEDMLKRRYVCKLYKVQWMDLFGYLSIHIWMHGFEISTIVYKTEQIAREVCFV